QWREMLSTSVLTIAILLCVT
ncbi:unnamed protein product, partial [Lathyrus oleraceus]